MRCQSFPHSRRQFLSQVATGAASAALTSSGRDCLADSGTGGHGFRRRGFYLHGCWVMNHPFSVRSWDRQDFSDMFGLLQRLGYNAVMIWPTPETAPMPLSEEDATTLRGYRQVIDDAKAAGLECWLTYCPNVISKEEVRSLRWSQRSLYASTRIVRLTDEATTRSYLQHRQSVLRVLDNADAVVVIDGDPGGYPGAPIEEYLRILKSDQQAVPDKRVIPWLWCGWGRDTSGGFWSSPVAPKVRVSLEALKKQMAGRWELLPGRSHREGWANGRVTVAETERAGLMPKSTIMCYEAIEFEPTPPVAVLDLTLDGNLAENPGPYTDFTLSAIHFANVSDGLIRDVTVRGSVGDGIGVQGGRDNRVESCLVENCHGHGFHPGTSLRGAVFSGNVARNNGGDGLYFCCQVVGIVVTGNLFHGNKRSGIGGLGAGCGVSDSFNVVANNVCRENGRWGIEAVGGRNNVITGNVCLDNSQSSPGRYSGILVADSTHTLVTGNRCGTDAEKPTQKLGIEETGTSDHNIFTANLCAGNSAGGLAVVGKNTQVSANVGIVAAPGVAQP